MTVGISLLTLVPGIVGGSETYARELVRALGRVGELDYGSSSRRSWMTGLPGKTVRSYRASRSLPGRVSAMTGRRSRPAASAGSSNSIELDVIHFPLTVMLPRVDDPPAAVSLLDIQHVFFPEFFSRAELAYRRVVYGWSLRRARAVIAISQHVKENPRRAAGRSKPSESK